MRAGKGTDLPPIGWSFNPMLCELYPSLFRWALERAPGVFEMAGDWSDQTYGTMAAHAPSLREQYCRMVADYCRSFGITVINDFDLSDQFGRIGGPAYHIRGYQGEPGSASDFGMAGRSVCSALSGKTQRKTASDIVNDVLAALGKAPPGQPAFVLAAAGDGKRHSGGGDIIEKVTTAMEHLRAAHTGRAFHFCRPSDCAATFRQLVRT
jgi:hypothetical protein